MDVVLALFIYTLTFLFVVISVLLMKQLDSPLHLMLFDGFSSLLHRVIPQFLRDFLGNTLETCLYTRNPVLQIIYIVLLALGYTSYTFTTYQHVSESTFGNLPFLLLSMNLVLFYVCSTTNPGVINEENISKYKSRFKYDDVLYKDNIDCKTCNIPKPARSKHCSVCDVCVSRLDHHCGWVNNCIGQHNYKFFFLFIVSLVIMTSIACCLTGLVFISIVEERKLHLSVYVDQEGNRFEADFSTVVTFLVSEYPVMAFLFLYLALLFFALGIFLAFHTFLVMSNRTTNEICKSRHHTNIKSQDATLTTELDVKFRSNRRLKQRLKTRIQQTEQPNSDGIKVHSKFAFFSSYNKGIFNNILEVLTG